MFNFVNLYFVVSKLNFNILQIYNRFYYFLNIFKFLQIEVKTNKKSINTNFFLALFVFIIKDKVLLKFEIKLQNF